MNSTSHFVALSTLLAIMSLAGCSHGTVAAPESPRAVKLEAVRNDTQGVVRFVALVRQKQRADLAFEGSGRIASIDVDVGDRVHEGQVLARLDPEPNRLRLEQADANAKIAAEELQERQTQWQQQQAMFADGSTSAATLTSAQVVLKTAQLKLRSAQSDLSLARRAVGLDEIHAPFDGSVVIRLQQPHAEVGSGQTVLQLNGEGHAQVVAQLPPQLASGLAPGQMVDAYRAEAPAKTFHLRLRSASNRLESGAIVQAIFDVVQGGRSDAGLLSGESLLMALPATGTGGLSVPLSAVTPQLNTNDSTVFVYRPDSRTVQRRVVSIGAVDDARVQIRRGLTEGELIVSAGTAFLTDGQAVLPFRPDTRLSSDTSP